MSYPALTFAAMLDNATRQEMEQFASLLQGFLAQEHNEDGSHRDITGASVVVTGRVTASGAGNFAGNLTAQGSVAEIGILTPPQVTAAQNNYNPTGLSTARHLRMSTDASRTLTGIAAQNSGTLLTLWNAGTFDLVLSNADAASTAGNRFRCPGNVNFTLNRGDAVDLWYDYNSAEWAVRAF